MDKIDLLVMAISFCFGILLLGFVFIYSAWLERQDRADTAKIKSQKLHGKNSTLHKYYTGGEL